VLSKESNSVLSIIWISSWHVHIIHEIHELELAWWCKGFTSLLLKHLFQVELKQVGISVEIEVDNLLHVIVSGGDEIVEQTLNNLSLTTSSSSDQDWAVIDLDELSD
jgi:hypothetical protein